MSNLPELPDLKEDYPLNWTEREPFQYQLDSQSLPAPSDSALPVSVSLPSPPEEPALSDSPLGGSLMSGAEELPEVSLPPSPEQALPSDSEAPLQALSEEQEAPPVLSDIHSELKKLTGLLSGQQEKKQTTPRRSLSSEFGRPR